MFISLEDAMQMELSKNISNAHPDMCIAAISVLMDISPTVAVLASTDMEQVEHLLGMVPDVDDAQKCIVFRYLKTFEPASDEEALLILVGQRMRL
jgi:hypothetical protein